MTEEKRTGRLRGTLIDARVDGYRDGYSDAMDRMDLTFWAGAEEMRARAARAAEALSPGAGSVILSLPLPDRGDE